MEPAVNGQRVFETVCATCHGEKAEGKREVMAPSIAGLPAWYTRIQIGKFKAGIRGHPEDPPGTAMRAVAASLEPEVVEAVTAYVATLPVHPTTADGESDGSLSRFFTERCAICHRYNGRGERVFSSAPLTTLSGWYLAESLRKFRDGTRGQTLKDEGGWKMRGVVKSLSDETIDELVRHVAALAERYPPGEGRQR